VRAGARLVGHVVRVDGVVGDVALLVLVVLPLLVLVLGSSACFILAYLKIYLA